MRGARSVKRRSGGRLLSEGSGVRIAGSDGGVVVVMLAVVIVGQDKGSRVIMRRNAADPLFRSHAQLSSSVMESSAFGPHAFGEG